MIKVEWFYWLVAAVFLVVAVLGSTDRADPKRLGSAAFWALLAFTFVYGTYVVAKTAPARPRGRRGARARRPGRRSASRPRAADADRPRRGAGRAWRRALRQPALRPRARHPGRRRALRGRPGQGERRRPAAAGAEVRDHHRARRGRPRRGRSSRWRCSGRTRRRRRSREGDRLLGHIGWAAILPQFLATLGLLFATAGRRQGGRHGHRRRPARRAAAARRSSSTASAWRVHHHHGQRLRRLPGDDRGDRLAGAGAAVPRQPAGGLRDRHARRLLRHPRARRWPPTSTSSRRRCWS